MLEFDKLVIVGVGGHPSGKNLGLGIMGDGMVLVQRKPSFGGLQ